MLTWPKASITPSWPRMRLATASSWRSCADVSGTGISSRSKWGARPPAAMPKRARQGKLSRRPQQDIGHVAGLHREHVGAGDGVAAAPARDLEQRRHGRLGDEIGDGG